MTTPEKTAHRIGDNTARETVYLKDLGMMRIFAHITEDNSDSIRMFEACGWTAEVRMRDYALIDGEYRDVISAAMQETSRRLLVEQIMPERVSDAHATVGSDLGMLMLFGGAERTEDECRLLLEAADLELTALIPFEPTSIHAGRRPSWAIIESKPRHRG